MTKYLLTLLLFFPIIAFAQKTKKVKIKNQKKKYYEVFYVLKSDPSVRHGKYEKLGTTLNSPMVTGEYKLGKKNGLWTEFFGSGPFTKICTKGFYTDGQKSGTWEYFDINGELNQRYNYDKNEMTFVKEPEGGFPKQLEQINGNDTLLVDIDQYPFYVGGQFNLNRYFIDNVEYPELAIENKIQGMVWLEFDLDEEGKIINLHVFQGLGYGCDEAALKVAEDLPSFYLPAKNRGTPVKVHLYMLVQFHLN